MKKIITSLFLFIITGISGIVSGQTYHAVSQGETFQFTQENITASDWVTYDYAGYTARTKCYSGTIPNLSKSERVVDIYVTGCSKIILSADGNSNPRTLLVSFNGGTATETAAWPNGCSEQTFDLPTTGDCKISISGNNGSIYLASILFEKPATPTIESLTVGEVEGTFDGSNILITLPFGSDLTQISPTIVLGGTADHFTPTTPQNFSEGTVTYTVYNPDESQTATYQVNITVEQQLSKDATLESLAVNNTPITIIEGQTSYGYEVYYSYDGIPIITANAAHAAATTTVTQASAVPGKATIQIVPQSGESDAITYTINFTRTAPLTECNLLRFTVNGYNGIIDQTKKTVQVSLPAGTDISTLTPITAVSDSANLASSGEADFSSPKQYVITAQDGITTQTYTVSVTADGITQLNTFPYVSEMNGISFSTPTWISGGEGYNPLYNVEWTGKTAKGAYRIGKDGTETSIMYLNLARCGKVIIGYTASGGRTLNIKSGEKNITGEKITSGTENTLSLTVESSEPVVVEISAPGATGGTTIYSITVTDATLDGIKNETIENVFYNGKMIINPQKQPLEIYDGTGRLLIKSKENISTELYEKGIYIVRITGKKNLLKIVK
ncbi:DUF5018 domain-containing protein [Coprobacter sp.]